MPGSPNAVLSLLPSGRGAVGSQASAEKCPGSREPAHQASRKRYRRAWRGCSTAQRKRAVVPSGGASTPGPAKSSCIPGRLTQGPGRTAPNRAHAVRLLRGRSRPIDTRRRQPPACVSASGPHVHSVRGKCVTAHVKCQMLRSRSVLELPTLDLSSKI